MPEKVLNLLSGVVSMDLYMRGRYLAAVERMNAWLLAVYLAVADGAE